MAFKVQFVRTALMPIVALFSLIILQTTPITAEISDGLKVQTMMGSRRLLQAKTPPAAPLIPNLPPLPPTPPLPTIPNIPPLPQLTPPLPKAPALPQTPPLPAIPNIPPLPKAFPPIPTISIPSNPFTNPGTAFQFPPIPFFTPPPPSKN
eukprot:Gb_39815 [translate_table: standard]